MVEAAVGIRGYVGTGFSGFSGVLKHRWEDFHVHEVDEEKHVVHLNTLISRADVLAEMKTQQARESGEGLMTADFTIPASVTAALSNAGFSLEDLHTLEIFVRELARLADPETAAAMMAASGRSPQDPPLTITLQTPVYCTIHGHADTYLHRLKSMASDSSPMTTKAQRAWKEMRGCLHTAIREHFPFLASDTVALRDLAACSHVSEDTLPTVCLPMLRPLDSGAVVHYPSPTILSRNCQLRDSIHTALGDHGDDVTNATIVDVTRVLRVYPKPACLRRVIRATTKAALPPTASEVGEDSDATVDGVVPPNESVATENMDGEITRCSSISDPPNDHGPDTAAGTPACCRQCRKAMHRKGRAKPRGNQNNKRPFPSQQKTTTNDPTACATCGKPVIGSAMMSHHDRWPKERPDYLYFHLWKCNRDTAEAIQMIGQCARYPSKNLTFAGTKDRRGITVQRVTGYRISVEQLKRALLHPKWDNNVRIGDLKYQDKRLQLGALFGNHFRVCIRGVDPATLDSVSPACASLQQHGFLNFFGLQRFGTRAVKTYTVGSSILQKQYETAVRQILGDCSGVATETQDDTRYGNGSSCKRRKLDVGKTESHQWCAGYLERGNPQEALERLPAHFYVERQLLQSLAEEPRDFLRALQRLPKNTLTLYVHAVQSFIWNHVAAHRHEVYGLTPVVGDLVQPGDDDATEVTALHTEDDLKSYSIHDVVLPIPGDGVLYPDYLHSYYQDTCTQHFGFDLNEIKGLRHVGLGEYAGGYRRVVVRPTHMTYSVIPSVPTGSMKLLLSDLDRLLGEGGDPHETITAFPSDRDETTADDCEGITDPYAGKAAVLLECTLPKSSYLTMACRELFRDYFLSDDPACC